MNSGIPATRAWPGIWGIGLADHEAARLAEDAGLRVVMNRCPKIEPFRPFRKPKLHLGI